MVLPDDPPRAAKEHLRSTPPPMNDEEARRPAADSSSSNQHISQYDGLQPSPSRNRFVRDTPALLPGEARSASASPLRLHMPFISPGQLAFSTVQFLPVPILVLNSLKTVVLANEAMGRLLGVIPEGMQDHPEEISSVLDRLRGQCLSQVGVDMLQDGQPVWVSWETFLDSVAIDMGSDKTKNPPMHATHKAGGDATPTAARFAKEKAPPSTKVAHHPPPNTVVEVIVSRKDLNKTTFDSRFKSRTCEFQAYAKMIITVWEVEENQTYFTLTFTHTETTPSPLVQGRKSVARSAVLEAAERKSIPVSSHPSLGSSRDSSSPSYRVSPGAVSLSSSPFPPLGPPSKSSSISSTPSLLHKLLLMKDALLDNTQMPILAMWKDGTVTYPNSAARKLLHSDADFDKLVDGFDILPNWTLYTEDFSRKLEADEHPIMELIKTEIPFSGVRIGMYDQSGKQHVYDVLGEVLRDDNTFEVLAGVVTYRDVTEMAHTISHMKEQEEARFKLICETMPQLVWTATADGMPDFYNTRWYDYTGLSSKESCGRAWPTAFHPDDVPEAMRRWSHSVETGESYNVEYRCKSREGDWRWFLGRAVALRDTETDKIERWFGTCTDIHEGMEANLAARRTREQLLSVLSHSQVTIFTLDRELKVTMLEGALIWDSKKRRASMQDEPKTRWYIGKDVGYVFNRLNSAAKQGERPPFLDLVEGILAGRLSEDATEHGLGGRWYRTRVMPIHKNDEADGVGNTIEGVIGVVMDVTELKAKESDLELQVQEKQQLLANEAAAKEASRLKSQFLANMSHEIRTPITGVIGMAELLLDLDLGTEQREYTENIYRSANALLTVINDILDFSKVESGRLDIEEVQFSLSLIVDDVNKMLSFAAERKHLDFQSDVSEEIRNDLIVLGDPGRVRQIITNLLTNSIKFTHQGYVKFSVLKGRETADSIEIKFVVEDSGIGIDEEVLKRLFQPFSQGDPSTARKFGGTGLGLTICKNLVDLMHGKINLKSTLGVGTTATFWIPFNKPNQTQTATLVRIDPLSDRFQSEMSISCNSSEHGTPSAEPVPSPLDKNRTRQTAASVTPPPSTVEEDLPASERAKIHILVVEDNAINQQIATKTIKKFGFNVTAAWNGKEALEYLTEAQEGKQVKPDIILMDVQMPVIDGYKCTHLLRHHLPYRAYVRNVPIVAMTASAIQGDREKCRKAGMDDYLAKPVKSKALETMLVHWSRTRRGRPSPSVLPAAQASTPAEDWEPGMADCSESGDACSNASIPVANNDVDYSQAAAAAATAAVLQQQGVGIVPIPDTATAPAGTKDHSNMGGWSVDGEKQSADQSAETPKPLTNNVGNGAAGHEGSHFPGYSLVPAQHPSRPDVGGRQPSRRDDEERALHLWNDKLIDAAGGDGGGGSGAGSVATSPLDDRKSFELLTEENMGRLEEEEARRQRKQ